MHTSFRRPIDLSIRWLLNFPIDLLIYLQTKLLTLFSSFVLALSLIMNRTHPLLSLFSAKKITKTNHLSKAFVGSLAYLHNVSLVKLLYSTSPSSNKHNFLNTKNLKRKSQKITIRDEISHGSWISLIIILWNCITHYFLVIVLWHRKY